MSFVFNMINIQGNKEILKSAKILESRARNTYQHMSTYRIRKLLGYDVPDPDFFVNMKKEYSSARKMIRQSGDYYAALILSLREGKIGNCTEDAMLTELLGKINGQTNIYTGNIELTRNGKNVGHLNHVISFITDKNIKNNETYFFKNKEAIVIDPWLGVTDFVGNYFNKLKSIYRKTFMQEKDKRFATFPNDELALALLRAETKTPKEFKSKKKEYFPITSLSIIPFVHNVLNAEKLTAIKESFPELVIKNFKTITLNEKKSNIAQMDKIA